MDRSKPNRERFLITQLKNRTVKLTGIADLLNEIIPIYIVLLVLFPLVLGYLIDFSLVDGRNFFINLLWMPFFTFPFSLFRKRFIHHITCLFYFGPGLIESVHWIIIKGPLTLSNMLTIANTNMHESIEFMQLMATPGLLILIPYFWLGWFSFRHPPKESHISYKWWGYAFALLLSFSFVTEKTLRRRFLSQGSPQVVKVIGSYLSQRKLFREAMLESTPRFVQATYSGASPKVTLVLIIGESCSRRHMSIYGGTRQTNPRLSRRKDLIQFSNAVSPCANTICSVLSMFSRSDPRDESGNKKIDLIDIFHAAGFKTYWLSNQNPVGIWDNMVTMLARKSDLCRFVNITSNTSEEALYNTSYDSRLFSSLSEAFREKVPKKFIVVHLMGNHTYYSI